MYSEDIEPVEMEVLEEEYSSSHRSCYEES